MKIELENKNRLIALGLGYYQFVDGDSFEPAAIGITSDSIVFYSDLEPDEIQNDAFAFSIKKVISLSDIKAVVIEDIVKNNELKRFGRLNIVFKKVDESTFFYFDKYDKKYLKRFIGALKYAEIRVVEHKVDLSPIA